MIAAQELLADAPGDALPPPGRRPTLPPPDHIYIELTDRCNLRCKHCYLSAGPSGRSELDLDVVRGTLEQFARLGGRSVALSGGEPLLHPAWREILRDARSLGLTTTIVTNGTLIMRPGTVEALRQSRPVIAVSIDGMLADTHDAIRGQGTFARTQAGLDALIGSDLREQLIVCFTPMRRNLGELPGLARWLVEHGVTRLYISPLEERGREVDHADEVGLSTPDKARLLAILGLMLADPTLEIHLEVGHLTHLFERLLVDWGDPGDPIETTLRVSAAGDLFLTAYVDDEAFRLGNVHRDRLADCWGSDRLRRVMEAAELRRHGVGACATCAYWAACGGGSPARAVARSGSILEGDDFCEAKQAFLSSWFAAL